MNNFFIFSLLHTSNALKKSKSFVSPSSSFTIMTSIWCLWKKSVYKRSFSLVLTTYDCTKISFTIRSMNGSSGLLSMWELPTDSYWTILASDAFFYAPFAFYAPPKIFLGGAYSRRVVRPSVRTNPEVLVWLGEQWVTVNSLWSYSFRFYLCVFF
jgi:hypothetical protein